MYYSTISVIENLIKTFLNQYGTGHLKKRTTMRMMARMKCTLSYLCTEWSSSWHVLKQNSLSRHCSKTVIMIAKQLHTLKAISKPLGLTKTSTISLKVLPPTCWVFFPGSFCHRNIFLPSKGPSFRGTPTLRREGNWRQWRHPWKSVVYFWWRKRARGGGGKKQREWEGKKSKWTE